MSEYLRLLQDTKKYLQQQKNRFIFVSSAQNQLILTSQKPKIPMEIVSSISTSTPFVQPKAEAKKSEPKRETNFSISLAPPKVRADYLEDVHTTLKKTAPNLTIHSDIPSDEQAKRFASSYQYKNQASPITILRFREEGEMKELLKEIATSLSHYFFPCHIVDSILMEKEDRWDAFFSAPSIRLIIASDYAIWEQNKLMSHYRENPSKSENFLGNVPLFMLPDLSLYLKDPMLKRSLWKALCQKVQVI